MIWETIISAEIIHCPAPNGCTRLVDTLNGLFVVKNDYIIVSENLGVTYGGSSSYPTRYYNGIRTIIVCTSSTLLGDTDCITCPTGTIASRACILYSSSKYVSILPGRIQMGYQYFCLFGVPSRTISFI